MTWFWQSVLYSSKAGDIQESVEYKGRLTISGGPYGADSMASVPESDWAAGWTHTGVLGGEITDFGLRRRLLNRQRSICVL